MSHAEKSRRRRAKLYREGKCATCLSKRDSWQRDCAACRSERASLRMVKLVPGKCAHTGCGKPSGRFRFCLACRMRDAEMARNRYAEQEAA